jgi:hypothetical protein
MQLMWFGKNKTVPSDWVKIYEAFERLRMSKRMKPWTKCAISNWTG